MESWSVKFTRCDRGRVVDAWLELRVSESDTRVVV